MAEDEILYFTTGSSEEFKIMNLDRIKVASIIHKGHYKNINDTLKKILKWISEKINFSNKNVVSHFLTATANSV